MSTSSSSTWAEDVTKEPIEWAVPDYFARRVISSVYGPRNSGKTLFACWLAAEASNGWKPPGDMSEIPARGRGPYALPSGALRVWLNSQEDDVHTVLRPRLDAAGYSAKRVRLTDRRWRLPRDLSKIADELREHAAGDAPDDVLILDSIQQHIVRPFAHSPSQETMSGLFNIASEFDISVILLGHTTKGKHASVEAMLQGSTVLQNMSKAIYVFGPDPELTALPMGDGEDAAPRHVLACERLGIAPKPMSIKFELLTEHDTVTGRREPFLSYLGPSMASARAVIDAAKKDDGSDQASKVAGAALWIQETLGSGGPMPTKDFESQARADGTYHSRNTFDRARKIAGVQTYKDGHAWWVCLKGQAPHET